VVLEEVLVDTDEVGWMGGVTIEDVSEEEDGYLPSPVRASVVTTMPTPPTITSGRENITNSIIPPPSLINLTQTTASGSISSPSVVNKDRGSYDSLPRRLPKVKINLVGSGSVYMNQRIKIVVDILCTRKTVYYIYYLLMSTNCLFLNLISINNILFLTVNNGPREINRKIFFFFKVYLILNIFLAPI
jgi:hypothetical protein